MQLGRVQLQIMRVLWDRGRASAREITDALNETEPIAHSTVQTLLRKLEAKGAVAHEVEDRTFVFFPLVQEEKVKRKATQELLERVFGGSASDLVAYLLKHEEIDRTELSAIRRMINEKKNKSE